MSEGSLEGKLCGSRHSFKSEGERRIAYFLDANLIKYQYEPGVLLGSQEKKLRIWYPDFYLPEFATYIEYYGLAGKSSYDDGIARKRAAYAKAGLDVIAIYPWSFGEDWQGYIMGQLSAISSRRYQSLAAKPYWAGGGRQLQGGSSPSGRYCGRGRVRY